MNRRDQHDGELGVEIEITPAMIEAGVSFLADQGLSEFSANVVSPETAVEFYRAMERARLSAASPKDKAR